MCFISGIVLYGFFLFGLILLEQSIISRKLQKNNLKEDVFLKISSEFGVFPKEFHGKNYKYYTNSGKEWTSIQSLISSILIMLFPQIILAEFLRAQMQDKVEMILTIILLIIMILGTLSSLRFLILFNSKFNSLPK